MGYNSRVKIIFAQGNPGADYDKTRHNVGFLMIDLLRDNIDGSQWKKHSKTNAEVSEISLGGEKVILVKPLTYYNETGLVARYFIDFYKLNPATDLLVIHDDLALPFGTIRIREKGSDAGNNGIKSLNQHVGDNYARIRIGIWNELRDRIGDTDFVLSRFSGDETGKLSTSILDAVEGFVDRFIVGKLESTSSKSS